MGLTSNLKAITKLLFQRSTLGGGASTAPFFGVDFSLWNDFWRDSSSKIDYEKELGDLRNSALLMAAYTWLSRGLTAARLYVAEVDTDNKETEQHNHPLVELVENPNPFYSGDELLAGVALSWLVAATAYILLVRDKIGRLSELWYEPHWSIRPVWPNDGSQFISGYQVNRNGEWFNIESDDVLVLRSGIDPDTRCGQSATSCLIREYYTDRQAAEFAALLMRQGLVPPLIVSLGDKDRPVGLAEMQPFKEDLKRQMRGGKAGEPAVVNTAANVELLNYDYSKVGLREVRAIPEERFCAAMGISPYSLHFGTSRQASTFSNVENYLRYDYQTYIVALHKYIAKRLAKELLPEFGDSANLRVKWNYDEVPLMQTDINAEWARVTNAFKGRILDQYKALEAIGYKPEEKHKDVYYPVPKASTSEGEPEDAPAVVPETVPMFTDQPPMKATLLQDGPSDEELNAGLDWWEREAPAEARGIARAKQIKPNGSAAS